LVKKKKNTKMVEAYRHDKARISLVIIAITLYAIVIILNQLSSRGSNISIFHSKFIYLEKNNYLLFFDLVLFPTQVGNVSRIFRNDITPASFVFPIIWTTIFIWQVNNSEFF